MALDITGFPYYGDIRERSTNLQSTFLSQFHVARLSPLRWAMLYLFMISVLALVAACASASLRTEGVTGPITWQATDFKLAKTTANYQPGERYSFMLVLKEINGVGITLTEMKWTVSQHGLSHSPSSQRTGSWRFRPHGELRIPFSFFRYCPYDSCLEVYGAPRWNITFTGSDDRGQPVKLVIDVEPPPLQS